jgi:hypothetical protein
MLKMDHCSAVVGIGADAALFVRSKITCFDSTTSSFSAIDLSEERSKDCAKFTGYFASSLRVLSFGIVAGSAELSFWDDEYRSQNRNLKNDVAPSTPVSFSRFLGALPLTVSIIDTRSTNTAKDSSMKQIKKDIERDSLTVNNICFQGSAVGVDFVQSAIRDSISSLIQDAHLGVLPSSVLKSLCYTILQTSSRTNCGGAVFEALLQVLDTSTVQVVPIALKSTPATVDISFGQSFEVSDRNVQEWGLRVNINCSTVFAVGAITQSEPMARVHISGKYACALFLKLYLPHENFPETERCKIIYEKAIFERSNS